MREEPEKRGAVIHWHRPNGTKEIHTDDPRDWIASLRAQKAYFEVFILSAPVPSQKGVQSV